MPEHAANLQSLLALIGRAVSGRPDVAAGYLYGSAARERLTALSDLDVALLFAEGCSQRARRLVASDVAGELGEGNAGRRVDVRDLEQLPLVLQGRILGEGRLASSNDEVRRVRFEATTRQLYFDFLPFHRADVTEGLRALREKLVGG